MNHRAAALEAYEAALREARRPTPPGPRRLARRPRPSWRQRSDSTWTVAIRGADLQPPRAPARTAGRGSDVRRGRARDPRAAVPDGPRHAQRGPGAVVRDGRPESGREARGRGGAARASGSRGRGRAGALPVQGARGRHSGEARHPDRPEGLAGLGAAGGRAPSERGSRAETPPPCGPPRPRAPTGQSSFRWSWSDGTDRGLSGPRTAAGPRRPVRPGPACRTRAHRQRRTAWDRCWR